MTAADRLGSLEAAYLVARDTRDRLDVARATGVPDDPSGLEQEARERSIDVHRALDAFSREDAADLAAADHRALRAIRDGIEVADVYRLPVGPQIDTASCRDADVMRSAMEAGGEDLRTLVEGCFAAAGADLRVGDEHLTRLQVLGRLGHEPEAEARRELFLALEPLWHIVDGDGDDGSPYRAIVAHSADRWRRGHSPIIANAAALGVRPADIETWAVTALAAWRAAVVEPARERGEPPIEPWDWWWTSGELQRAVDPISATAALEVNAAYAAALGASLPTLGVTFDAGPRPGRPAVSMAFTTFGARPHRRPDDTWMPGRPTVVIAHLAGGFRELCELVHETGHAIHIAGIRTRPAFADWPDSDAFTEALAEMLALDLHEPRWLRHWLPGGQHVAEATAIRCRYAEVVMDAAWALFEIRMHGTPCRRPNDVWTEITATWLGIAAHPEWSWWAIRGQLVESPGYMANYAVGAVLATDMRAAIRERLGDWTHGDRRWYAWVRDHVYRFGLERPSRDVLHDLLGRPPTADALLREIGRAASAG